MLTGNLKVTIGLFIPKKIVRFLLFRKYLLRVVSFSYQNLLKNSFSKLPPPDTTEADQDYYNKRQKLPRGYRWFGPWANTNNYKIKEIRNEPNRIDEMKRKLKKTEIKATTPIHGKLMIFRL